MAHFKELSVRGTKEKVVVNMDRVLFMRPHDSYSIIHFSDKQSVVVTESVADIMQAPPLANA